MKINVPWKNAPFVLFLIMLVGEIFAMVALVRLNMLPVLYLIALGVVFALLGAIVGLLLFTKGKGDRKRRRIIACVLSVLILCGSIVIATVASDVIKTLQATREEAQGVPVRAVYVLKDNSAKTLADTAGFAYGYVKNYDESCTGQVLEEVTQQTAGNLSTAGYTNAFLMAKALLENRIDAIVLNGGYISILEDTEGFEDFSRHVRVLAVIEVDDSMNPSFDSDGAMAEENSAALEPEFMESIELLDGNVDYDSLAPFVVYVSASDSYDSEIVMNSRSDVNILAVVNPLTKQVLLINTPRDYYVPNSGGGGKKDKLTHCGIYGTSCSMKTLGNLYDAQIDYYVRINFTGFKKLINAMDGITVYSDYAFLAIKRTEIQEGENHLNGRQALDFARERYALKNGDHERGKHQMQVIKAVIEKATSGTTILTNYSDIMASVEGMFSMNIPAEMVSNLMKMQLREMPRWNIVSYSVTGTDANEECFSVPGMKLAVIKPDQNSVSKAIRLIDMVYAGELLTEEVVNSIT